ncbi:potassium channel family protein [Glaciecola sp. 2405UD65-10]|uniref:potassium channel family protein n=1 Tax=Glaciecola sp. 2405UD65-10 TaxID=3397244 RepID=UPI003B59D4A4
MKVRKIDRLFLIFIVYVAVIVFAAMFYHSHGTQFSKPITKFSDALYFSVVTITTLGYGDISPTSNFTKLMVSVQTIYGIFTFGLLMNSAASKAAQFQMKRQIEAAKNHAQLEYEHFRSQLLNIILGVADRSSDPVVVEALFSLRDNSSLIDFKKFRSAFSSGGIGKPIFYELQNRLDDKGSDVLAEVYLELDILSETINYLLNKVETENRVAHDALVRVSQASKRYKHSYMYSGEQGKYVGRLIFEIMASCSVIEGGLEKDFIKESIDEL